MSEEEVKELIEAAYKKEEMISSEELPKEELEEEKYQVLKRSVELGKLISEVDKMVCEFRTKINSVSLEILKILK